MIHFNTKLILFSMVVGLVGAGCNSSTSGGGTESAYQTDSISCSQEFVTAYNSVVDSFHNAKLVSDLDVTESAVKDFADKYDGVVCDLLLKTETHPDGVPTLVDAKSQAADWQKLIDDARAGKSVKELSEDFQELH